MHIHIPWEVQRKRDTLFSARQLCHLLENGEYMKRNFGRTSLLLILKCHIEHPGESVTWRLTSRLYSLMAMSDQIGCTQDKEGNVLGGNTWETLWLS